MSQHIRGNLGTRYHMYRGRHLDAFYPSIRGLSPPDDIDEEVQRSSDVLRWHLVSTLATYTTRLSANMSTV